MHDTPSYHALLYDFSLKNFKQCQEWYVICDLGISLIILTYFLPSFSKWRQFFDKQADGHTDKTHWKTAGAYGVNIHTETLISWFRRVYYILF